MASRAERLMILVAMFFSIPNVLATLPLKMENFIRAVEQIEESNPGLGPLSVVRSLRWKAGPDDAFIRYILGPANDGSSEGVPRLPAELIGFIQRAVPHRVTYQRQEEGVVLCADGTTVALAPLLLGLEVGLSAAAGAHRSGLHSLTLAYNMGQSFLRNRGSSLSESFGPDGCWNNMTSPRVFTLSGTPSLATDAWVNGGMDGAILGEHLSGLPQRPVNLSVMLEEYYCHSAKQPGLEATFRRENFRKLVTASILQEQVLESLALYWRLGGEARLEGEAGLENVVKAGVQEFVHRYMECPAIIPRCQWGAEPYRGKPVQLGLPLAFMYIHHTHTPGQPCRSFQECATDMRAMQRFHQDDRGWNDIGYSFVAGSDGYIYEGRGWQWQGAHTRGQNSRGYGVAFIGNYSAALPSQRAMELVRDRLAACAVTGGRLVANFTLHGHRQLVNTMCPGEALHSEISGWKRFREVQPSGL